MPMQCTSQRETLSATRSGAIRVQVRLHEIEIMRRNFAETPPTGKDPKEDCETFEREQWEQEVAAWNREHRKA
jgi:hypothetical protein